MKSARKAVTNLRIGYAACVPAASSVLAETAWALEPSSAGHRIQPAMISALALTSLVLFCVYLFQKYKAARKTPLTENRWAAENPFQIRLYETQKALNSLFSKPGIPMAKTDIEQGRILEATPALYLALGYKKREFLRQEPDRLGLLPADDNDVRRIIDTGWTESRTRLYHKTTGQGFKCRILNIATHFEGYPTVLSIIPDLIDTRLADKRLKDPAKRVGDLN